VKRAVTRRFIGAVVVAAAAGALALVTVIWSDWLESVFGVRPDRESGSAEWFIALTLAAVAVSMGVLAFTEWKRVDARDVRGDARGTAGSARNSRN
jgi:hypothetical protein